MFLFRSLLSKENCVYLIPVNPANNSFTMNLSTKSTEGSQVEQPVMNTLVFFDTESTGLPSFQSPKTVQITELSMVAVHRKHFDDPSFNFRIINKISLCIQPRSPVSLGASSISGLDNFNLETQQKFSTSTAELLKKFLGQLDSPICFLAHNGKCFDFPLLKAEMENVLEGFSEDVFYLDTYHILRELVPPPGYISPSSVSTSDTKSVLDLEEIINNGRISEESLLRTPPQMRSKYPKYSSSTRKADKNATSPTSFDREDLDFSDQVVDLTKKSDLMPQTPRKPKFPAYSPIYKTLATTEGITSSENKPLIVYKNAFRTVLFPNQDDNNLQDPGKQIRTNENSSNCQEEILNTANANNSSVITHTSIQMLNSETNAEIAGNPAKKRLVGGSWKKNVKGYKLSDLYERVVGEPLQNSHQAEVDTMALMKLCFHVPDFSLWMDAKAKSFTGVKSMW